jgi:hypothetical protein
MFWRIEPPVQHDDLSVAACVVQAGFLPVEQEWSYWNRPKYEMKLNIAPGEAAVFAGLGTKIRTKGAMPRSAASSLKKDALNRTWKSSIGS